MGPHRSLVAAQILALIIIACDLQHSRQIRAPRTAWVIHVVRNLLWAVGCDFIEPVDQLGIAASVVNQPLQGIAASASAFLTVDVQHIEFADQVTEYVRRRGALASRRTPKISP